MPDPVTRQFPCPCGAKVETYQPPGAYVRCPACQKIQQVPGAAVVAMENYPGADGKPAYWQPPASGMAIASLILGCTAIIFTVVTGIPAIILGIVALSKIRRSEGRIGGRGLAVTGISLGATLWIIPAMILLPSLLFMSAVPRAQMAAQSVQCSDNLRNINLAVFQYCVGSNDELPPADQNICQALAVYMGDYPGVERGGEWWRCPNDSFIPADLRAFWCSYAPNAGVEEPDELIGVFSSSSDVSSRIGTVAPDTISWIEMWTPPNVVPGHPGYELKLNQSNPESRNRSMVEPGKELVAIRSYTTARPVVFDEDGLLTDCGNYLFLRAFVGKPVSEMYHNGRVNVAFIDGHVETMNIADLIATPRPIDNPMWTRDAD